MTRTSALGTRHSAESARDSRSRSSRAIRNAARVLPEPVGAATRVSAPDRMLSHARRWTTVGSPRRSVNQRAIMGWRDESGTAEIWFSRAPMEDRNHLGTRYSALGTRHSALGGCAFYSPTWPLQYKVLDTTRGNSYVGDLTTGLSMSALV